MGSVHSYLSAVGKRAKRKIRFPINALNSPETQQCEGQGRTRGRQVLRDSEHQEVAWLFPMRCPKAVGQGLLLPLAQSGTDVTCDSGSVRPCGPGMIPHPWLDPYAPMMCPQPTLTLGLPFGGSGAVIREFSRDLFL